MSIFKDKILMITGGTGSFGNAVFKQVSSYEFFPKEAVKFSAMGVYSVLFAFRHGQNGDIFIPANNCDLMINDFFKEGDAKTFIIDEFNSNCTRCFDLEDKVERIAD